MPLPKQFAHQFPVMMTQDQLDHVAKMADGGSLAAVVRAAIDLQMAIERGDVVIVPRAELIPSP